MTARKAPQDHQISFDEVEGSELLVSISQVKGSDQLRLLSQLKALGVMDTKAGDEVDVDDLDFEKVADLVDYVGAKFAKSPKEFDDFTKGKGGFERAMNLVVSYAAALGE